jgi:predicted nucleic acid-binding protein
VTVLVDSDVLIEVSRGRNQGIVVRWMELSDSNHTILYSPVSEAELWAGARPSERISLTGLFAALRCVPIDSAIGKIAGDFLRIYGKSHALEMGDALIAASAVVTGAVLWTRNRKHYPMSELMHFE